MAGHHDRIFNFASVSRGRWESSFFNIEIGSHADAVVKHKSDAMPCGFRRMHATIRSTLFTRAGCSENSWKKAYANASYPTIRQMLPMISTRSIVNRDFCERPRDLGNYAFALKLSGRRRFIAPFRFDQKEPPVGGNKEISPDGNAHDEAVTINKWRRYVRSNEVPIQADIWFYKNANKIRLFTSGIGVLRCAM